MEIIPFTFLIFISVSLSANADINNDVFISHAYPKLMGMNIGKKDYYDPLYRNNLSKVDVVILGFYPGWERNKNKISIREAVDAIKKLNPNISIGQYTMLNEAPDPNDIKSASRDIGQKVEQENWWLKNASGDRVQWTDTYQKWDVNISSTTLPDAEGLRFPAWLARRDFKMYFQNNPNLDIWYLDNALSKPPVKLADWNNNGRNEENINHTVSLNYRLGNVSEWAEINRLRPNTLLIANSDDITSPEYTGQLHGVFMEALIGKSWSLERWRGWRQIMLRYRQNMLHTKPPHLVGFNVWGRINDYQRMRYGLTSCLLDDGYYTYTDESKPYGTVPWFDEFDIDLGNPIEPPQTQAWIDGVFRRKFEQGMVLVNPTITKKTVIIENGYRKIHGKQDPSTNNGNKVVSLTLNSKDGIILLKEKY